MLTKFYKLVEFLKTKSTFVRSFPKIYANLFHKSLVLLKNLGGDSYI